MNKSMIAILVILIISVWGTIFYQNSSVERVADKRGAIEILEQINIGESTIVLYDSGDYIKGEEFVLGALGWGVKTISQATNDRNDETVFRPDNLSHINNDDIGFYYGYVNSNKVDYIRFKTGDLDIKYKVNSYHWYIPDFSDKKDGSFNAEQFSIILKDGTEIYYPFEELQ
ncbi:hypothetical protein N0O92_19315 [Alkalihalobacillus sp. MEB130]|uniref:hypothetical protein n=1 Tax=Alkalihalobacillus sp. MEB130 TaxID=2976704 RepID=UPI0028E080F2|nr:hypothetical protein [Alkalihalobacillus sp. MEB130]MDT8862364.1 hypothetical protein [Alkalihalobacillus sp. MEB130]